MFCVAASWNLTLIELGAWLDGQHSAPFPQSILPSHAFEAGIRFEQDAIHVYPSAGIARLCLISFAAPFKRHPQQLLPHPPPPPPLLEFLWTDYVQIAST